MDPLSGSQWSRDETVAGFARSTPNSTLIGYAEDELRRRGSLVVLDIGCGAGRNAIPLARLGATVIGTDLSAPMLAAARDRAHEEQLRVSLALAPMDALPARDHSVDLVIAHGIWNLARSAVEFRRAVAEAGRVARAGAGLFVFTFSRNTFGSDVPAVAGELFVFTQFAGEPQCFLTEDELVSELRTAGFARDESLPVRELNRVQPRALRSAGRLPVIYEGAFRREPVREAPGR